MEICIMEYWEDYSQPTEKPAIPPKIDLREITDPRQREKIKERLRQYRFNLQKDPPAHLVKKWLDTLSDNKTL